MFVIALLKHETWQSHLNKLVKVLFERNSFRARAKLISDTHNSWFSLFGSSNTPFTNSSHALILHESITTIMFWKSAYFVITLILALLRSMVDNDGGTDGRSKSRKDGQSIVCSSILMILQSSGKSFSGLVTTSLGKAWSKATIAMYPKEHMLPEVPTLPILKAWLKLQTNAGNSLSGDLTKVSNTENY